MRVAVIGGGAAGMMASGTAARAGHDVTLFEKNEKLGKKLFITGKGRCNVTNIAQRDVFFQHVLRNPRFLFSAWSAFDNTALMELIEREGTPLKTERGGRVFPVSDKSSDILRAMERYVRDGGVRVLLNTAVSSLITENGRVAGVTVDGRRLPFDAVIVCTGGVSYPSTGSTGDGYRFARASGHEIKAPVPSLVPLVTKETWPGRLAGLTLKNVNLRAVKNGKRVFDEQGELLLTHFGVSGPLVLSLSGVIAEEPEGTELFIDLKPAIPAEELNTRILNELNANARKQVRSALHALLPERLLLTVLELSGIPPELSVGELRREQRRKLVETLKAVPLTVERAGAIAEAVVTRGGVSTKDINARTMESRRVSGLFFAGEVLDVDATTGGYNLQIAWSTGHLAGLVGQGEQKNREEYAYGTSQHCD